MLTAAPRTRAELENALRRRNVPDQAASAVLDRFAEIKLIDDAMFASAWVESRHHGRGLARRALAAELGRRGVAATDIRAAVSQLTSDQELATARALVGRKLASTRGQPAQVRVRRLAGMLARKGYSPGLAYRVVREELERDGQDYGAAEIDGDDIGLDGEAPEFEGEATGQAKPPGSRTSRPACGEKPSYGDEPPDGFAVPGI